jgi:hypothetical protein
VKGKIIPRGLKREERPRSGEKTTHKPHWFQRTKEGEKSYEDGNKEQLPFIPPCVPSNDRH